MAMNEGKKVTWVGIISNVLLSGLKILCGIIGHSQAMIADAIHSISDIIATAAVLLGLNYAEKPEDEDHPYGHGKIESIIALFMGIFLFGISAFIIYSNIKNLAAGEFVKPEFITLIAAGFSVILKEWLYRYTIKTGKKLNSPSIIANAYDHRSDAYSSFGVLIGIGGTFAGYNQLDSIAAVVVAFFIIHISWKITKEAFDDLMDSQIPEEVRESIVFVFKKEPGDFKVKDIRGRRLGSKYIVEVTLDVSPYSDILTETKKTDKIKKSIIKNIPEIKEVIFIYSTDKTTVRSFEKEFKTAIAAILKDHSKKYCQITAIDYHFLPDKQEVHFTLVVPGKSTLKESHDLTEHLQEEIAKVYPNAEAIIHIEPEEKV